MKAIVEQVPGNWLEYTIITQESYFNNEGKGAKTAAAVSRHHC